MSRKVPKGFNCQWCGKHHEYSMYVYAHTHVELVHTCDRCGAKHKVLGLVARITKDGGKEFKHNATQSA